MPCIVVANIIRIVIAWFIYPFSPGLLYRGCHDDVIKWNHFPRDWPFERGIHRSPVNSLHKRPVTRRFEVFFDLHPNKRLSKQSWGWWFETLSHPLWHHCNGGNCMPTCSWNNTKENGQNQLVSNHRIQQNAYAQFLEISLHLLVRNRLQLLRDRCCSPNRLR